MVYWGIIFLCWLPYIIIRYPAGFEWDGYHQILQFYEGITTNHWPPASSAWMGIFVAMGESIFGSTNVGIFLYCFLQILLGSLVFSYCLVVMKRLGIAANFRRFSLALFALIPIYPGYISSVVKDAPFSYMVLLFLLIYVQMLFVDKTASVTTTVELILSGFFMCILRNNGIILVIAIVIAQLIALLVMRNKKEFCILSGCVSIIVLTMLYTKLLLPQLGIAPTEAAEAFSVPFQQTARLSVYRSEAISDEDKEIIGKVLDFEMIQKNYDPKLADPVKGTYHAGKGDLVKYFAVWFKEGLYNPDIYVDAFLLNSLGFCYPDVRMGNSNVVSGVYSSIYNTGSVQFPLTEERMQKRVDFRNRISLIENLPVVYPFVNIAIQLWIPVFLLLMAIVRKKKSFILALIPSLISVLVCLASPTYDNNGARYALPVIYTNMLMIGLGKFGNHE